jgi:putative ABC transport system permease protein
MRGTALLAWRYISHYRGRTAILVSAVTLTIFLPLATRWITQKFEENATARAKQTPLIVGTKGSRFGLAIHGLYFRGEAPATIPQSELTRVEELKLGRAIPILCKFKARGFPIVGTTRDYLSHRNLVIELGERWERLGDCVVGSHVARSLGLACGDRLLSEPENLFDLSGPSPLNMRVSGILASTGTADDEAVFCDLKTTWVIQGIGHGHKLEGNATDADGHKHAAGKENLSQHNEITDENVKSFHFHGRPSTYPLTAIVVVPETEKAEALIMGKYLASDDPSQVIRPIEVVSEIIDVIGRVRRLFDVGVLFLAFGTALLMVLVLMLSVRLRQREIRTMYLLGCSRGTIFWVVSVELMFVLATSIGLAWVLAMGITTFSDTLIRMFL